MAASIPTDSLPCTLKDIQLIGMEVEGVPSIKPALLRLSVRICSRFAMFSGLERIAMIKGRFSFVSPYWINLTFGLLAATCSK